MSATAGLMREHRVIEKVLRALDRKLTEASETRTVPVAFLRTVVMFSRQFIDRCHHRKEEGCLFPCLENRGVPKEGGLIGVMLEEHEMGRTLVKQITETLDRYERGAAGVEDVLDPCRQYMELLQHHIFKEDEMLFPMGDGVMSSQDQQESLECYKREENDVGHGEHDRLVDLAEEIAGGDF